MNKLYFGIPIVGVAAFALYFFLAFDKPYEAAKQKKKDDAYFAKVAASMQEQEERVRVANEAKIETEKRNAARKEEKEKLAKEEQDRQESIQKRAKALSEVGRFEAEKVKLDREIKEEETLIQKIAAEKAGYETERTFLTNYVQLAKKNSARLLDLVVKFDEAEKNRLAAAAAAAAVAAKNAPSK